MLVSQVIANILNFAEVEDTYPIMYVPQEAFTVHLPHKDNLFNWRGKPNVAIIEEILGYSGTMSTEEAYVFTTRVYTKGEEMGVKQAYELLRNSGYLSVMKFN